MRSTRAARSWAAARSARTRPYAPTPAPAACSRLRDRVTYPQEDWTLKIVVTDHVHRDEGSHRGRSGLETTA
ncbi:hypothetical protein [Streptomyces mirabilis]|uniref:hypothetical protein n=1 Tax=Streptomyces mirabilis TaxID=68239 RepID=UPI00167E67CA|nr:hypothetical protein [Streptomyces mirabilis]